MPEISRPELLECYFRESRRLHTASARSIFDFLTDLVLARDSLYISFSLRELAYTARIHREEAVHGLREILDLGLLVREGHHVKGSRRPRIYVAPCFAAAVGKPDQREIPPVGKSDLTAVPPVAKPDRTEIAVAAESATSSGRETRPDVDRSSRESYIPSPSAFRESTAPDKRVEMLFYENGKGEFREYVRAELWFLLRRDAAKDARLSIPDDDVVALFCAAGSEEALRALLGEMKAGGRMADREGKPIVTPIYYLAVALTRCQNLRWPEIREWRRQFYARMRPEKKPAVSSGLKKAAQVLGNSGLAF